MARRNRRGVAALAALGATLVLTLSGCTNPREYVRNGFKVGPNYSRPPAALEQHWIDAADVRVCNGQDLSHWWTVFNDPTLNRLVVCAYRQNLTLREAGFRVLQARAQLGIAVGEIFPQTQTASGGYSRVADSQYSGPGLPATTHRFFDQWNMGFSLAWEVDLWGRLRRAITAADDQLGASVGDYDDVLVTLLGDVATNYVQVRTLQERIRLLERNVILEQWVVGLLEQRLKGGFHATQLDVDQAVSALEQTASQIPPLEISLRQAENQLCILLAMPPTDLRGWLGEDHIPTAPPDVVIDIPASLLCRRGDVRRAERQAAAQAEQIGIAQAQLYPALSLGGSLGWEAHNFPDLFTSQAFNGSFGPSFNWNILNYGRIVNNVRFQDARFQELVAVYQQSVLRAQAEVENGLITFLRSQRQMRHLAKSADAATDAVKTILRQYMAGLAAGDFNRYAVIEQNRVQQQDLLAQSYGQIAQGLIDVYRALGGGWEIRLPPGPTLPPPSAPPHLAPAPQEIPLPAGTPPPAP